jgi:superfamily II DNA or RNA helicase
MGFEHFVALSATVNKEVRQRILDTVPNIVEYKVSARKAISDNILPDPKVILIRLTLSTSKNTECIVLNKGKGKPITVDWAHRGGYMRTKYPEVRIMCTEWQYYNYLSSKIDSLKNSFIHTKQDYRKNMWLQKAGERLRWLAEHKNKYVKWLMENVFNDMRSITFCADIKQTELLCPNAINSKNEKAMDILDDFNEGRIDHIATCQMLNEGVNLVDCKLGMFAALNSSKILQKQKLGRLLRHKEPIIVIPYYVATRDEELVNEMKKDYNPDLIQEVTHPKDIKL